LANLFSGSHSFAWLERLASQAFTIGLRMYSAQLLDHFQNPRNVGEIADADAAAEIENPACGDVLRLTVTVSEGRISQVRFKAKGCVAAIACGSALTELLAGKALVDAKHLRREAIIAVVGGLPQASTHAAQLAIDALSAALGHINF
jgi:nitrogen fixation protein NifU and related proteins